jgi:MFS family permease
MMSNPEMPSVPWWRELTRYHWFVFIVAAVGWLADCMDQQLFVLSRDDAMSELLASQIPDPHERAQQVPKYGGYATAIFLMGWAVGGLGFGVLGDRWGRVRTMLLTIVIYSIFTGVSIFATNVWDYAIYRFLTGLGVGGEFAVGVALVAEFMPDRVRPYTLGMLQACSAIGNCAAALIYIGISKLELQGSLSGLTIFGLPLSGWRIAFLVGTVPAAIALIVRRRLQEPERWKATASAHVKRGSYRELFGTPRWRKNALLGLVLGFAAVVGLWGIGFFGVQLSKTVFTENFKAAGMTPAAAAVEAKIWGGWYSFMLNVGAAAGMMTFGWLAQGANRRFAFALSFILAMVSTAASFWYFAQPSDIFWMTPLTGFCLLSLFSLLAIYFPELFPTRLRSTGTSFCYNVGRFVAAVGPYFFGFLTSEVFTHAHGFTREPMRYAGVVMCAIFLLGLAVLPWCPETKNEPLPE